MQPGPDYTACEDGFYLGAREIWPEMLYEETEDGSMTVLEYLEGTGIPGRMEQAALDDLANYSYFRYQGATPPASAAEAFRQICAFSFFPPTHIWLGGKFTDCLNSELMAPGRQVSRR